VHITATREGTNPLEFDAVLRIDTPREAEYYRNGGILPYVLRAMAGPAA
jgi:aconitate hydratase